MFENTHHEQTSDDEQVSRLIDRGRMFSICPIMDLLINNAYLSNDDLSDWKWNNDLLVENVCWAGAAQE